MGMLTRFNKKDNDRSIAPYNGNRVPDIFDGFFGRTLFDDLLNVPGYGGYTDSQQLPTVREQDDKFEISLLAPGLKKEDFSITVGGNSLTISYDAGDRKDHYAYATKYSKTYTLPTHANAENIDASYESGILVVDVPKTEAAKPRAIKVK